MSTSAHVLRHQVIQPGDDKPGWWPNEERIVKIAERENGTTLDVWFWAVRGWDDPDE